MPFFSSLIVSELRMHVNASLVTRANGPKNRSGFGMIRPTCGQTHRPMIQRMSSILRIAGADLAVL